MTHVRVDPRTRAAFLAVAAVVLVTWSFATPIFEGPDEFLHWQYARYIHDRAQLPIYTAEYLEANQPPLYYLALAPIAWHTPTPPPLTWVDGRDRVISPFLPRLHLNASDDLTRYWPIRVARLVTVLISFCTVLFCLLAGMEATGRASTGLLAAGFTLLLPQFAFRGTHVNNDALVTMTAALTTWVAVRIVRRGFTWRWGWLGAAAVAATFLSKVNGLCVAAALAVAILTDPVPWRARLRHLSVFALALLIVAPWTIRNLRLYGDPVASSAMYHAAEAFINERPLWTLHHVTTLPREAFKTFVGNFGYLTVKLPKWAYAVYLAFMLFALAGLVWRLVRERHDPRRTILRVAIALVALMAASYALLVRINLQFDQPQGRYLFPALPALMVALAIGIEGWRPWAGTRAWPAWATLGGWGLAHLLVFAVVFVPAFYPPLVPRLSRAVTDVQLQPAHDLQAQAAPDLRAASDRQRGTTPSDGAAPEDAAAFAAAAWTFSGAQPTLAADVRVPAADAGFAIVDIEAHAPVPDLTGTFIFSLEDAASPEGAPATADAGRTVSGQGRVREVRVPFEWIADGRRRGPRLCLMNRPDWHGVVTHVRLVLAEDPDGRLRGTPVIVRRLALVGSPPGNDF